MRLLLIFLAMLWVVPARAQAPSAPPLADLFPRRDVCNVTLKDEGKLGVSWEEIALPEVIPGAFIGYRCIYCSPITTVLMAAQDTKGQGPLDGARSADDNTSLIYTDPAAGQRYIERVRAELQSAKAFCDLESIEIIGSRRVSGIPMIGIRYAQRCKARGWPEQESAISYRAIDKGCYFEVSAVWEGGPDLEPVRGQWDAIFAVMSRARWDWQSSAFDRNTPSNRARQRAMRGLQERLHPPPVGTVGPSSGPMPPADKKY